MSVLIYGCIIGGYIICIFAILVLLLYIKVLNSNIDDLMKNADKNNNYDNDDEMFSKDRDEFLSKLSFSNLKFKDEDESCNCYVDITFLKNNKTFLYKFEYIHMYPRFFIVNEEDEKKLRNIFTDAEKEWLKRHISGLYADHLNNLRIEAMAKEKIESDKYRDQYL